MGFCKSNQKSIPVVGFLTCNDCDVLRAKTGIYRQVTHKTIIPPTPHGRDEPFYPPAYIVQPFHYGMYLPPSNVIANHRLIVNSSHMTQRGINPTFFYGLTLTI